MIYLVIVLAVLLVTNAVVLYLWLSKKKQHTEALVEIEDIARRRSGFARRQKNQAERLNVDALVKQLEDLDVHKPKKRQTVITNVRLKNPNVGVEVIDEAIRIAREKL